MKIRKNIKIQKEEFRAEPTTALHYETKEEQPTVIRKPILVYPVIIQEQQADDRHLQCYVEIDWNPVKVLYLKIFKGTVILCGMLLHYVKQILNSWAIFNRIIPQSWKHLATTVLEAEPQLQQKTWLIKEGTVTEQ